MTPNDTNSIAKILHLAHKQTYLSNDETAAALRITAKQWRAYCHGKEPIPPQLLIWILDAGLSFLAFRYRHSPSARDARRKRYHHEQKQQ